MADERHHDKEGPAPMNPPAVADVLRTIALRCGYILGACKGEKEMRLEAEEIKRLVASAQDGLRAWWHGPEASAPSATQASMDRDWWRAQGIEACLDRMAIMGERLKNEQPRTLPSAACLAPATQPTIPGAISPSAQDIGQSAPPATQRSDWDVRDWYAAAKESGGAVCHEDGWCVIDREELARLQAPPSSIAQSEAERLWDRFIAHLNKIEPLIFKKEDGPQPHRNLHGSIKRYKAIFVASATQTSSAAQDSSTMNCAFQNGATTKGAKE